MSNFTQREEIWLRAYTAGLTGALAKGWGSETARQTALLHADLAVSDFGTQFGIAEGDCAETEKPHLKR